MFVFGTLSLSFPFPALQNGLQLQQLLEPWLPFQRPQQKLWFWWESSQTYPKNGFCFENAIFTLHILHGCTITCHCGMFSLVLECFGYHPSSEVRSISNLHRLSRSVGFPVQSMGHCTQNGLGIWKNTWGAGRYPEIATCWTEEIWEHGILCIY